MHSVLQKQPRVVIKSVTQSRTGVQIPAVSCTSCVTLSNCSTSLGLSVHI